MDGWACRGWTKSWVDGEVKGGWRGHGWSWMDGGVVDGRSRTDGEVMDGWRYHGWMVRSRMDGEAMDDGAVVVEDGAQLQAKRRKRE